MKHDYTATVQHISPDLMQWICDQAQSGHPPDAVLAAMRASGWSEDVAARAIARATSGRLLEPPSPVPVPEPDIAAGSCVLHTTDREVQVLTSMQLPRVVVFGSLLSNAECDALVELGREQLAPSTTIDNWSGGSAAGAWRTSHGMFFQRGQNELLQRIEARIAELVRWPVECGEAMQMLRYGPGAQYCSHHDYFDPSVPSTGSLLERGGQRVATLVMYLNTPSKGGATVFPDVGLAVTPLKGNAVFFSYDRPHRVTRTLHGGAPVIEGEKWVATKWLRERTI